MGEQTYSMRLWLRRSNGIISLTVADVRSALQEQNTIVAAGKLGAAPTGPSRNLNIRFKQKGA